jgi:hypothetical protein
MQDLEWLGKPAPFLSGRDEPQNVKLMKRGLHLEGAMREAEELLEMKSMPGLTSKSPITKAYMKWVDDENNHEIIGWAEQKAEFVAFLLRKTFGEVK